MNENRESGGKTLKEILRIRQLHASIFSTKQCTIIYKFHETLACVQSLDKKLKRGERVLERREKVDFSPSFQFLISSLHTGYAPLDSPIFYFMIFLCLN